jgi:transposase
MYKVLDEDTIQKEILPCLRKSKRGFETKSNLTEVINAILYKLKTGCQWRLLPVKSLFEKTVLSRQSVYHHFRKWCKSGNWLHCRIKLLKANKSFLDLSSGDIDGSHTTALRGGKKLPAKDIRKGKHGIQFT